MNLLLSVFFIAASVAGLVPFKPPAIKAGDLRLLTGAQWTGTLTYLDYGKNKKVSIPVKLTVTQATTDKLTWIFEYQYPDEPQENSKENVTLSPDGRTFDGEEVVERTKLANKTLKIVTRKKGMDNDKPSLFQFTYLLGPAAFSIRKEVKYDGSSDFFVRNEYSWRR